MDRVARSLSLAPLVCVFCVCCFSGQTHVAPLTVVGFYPSSLGSTHRRWALPSVGFYPSSLGSTLRWALPFVVEFYPLPFVAGPCRCGIFYASMVVLSSFTPPGCWVVDTLWLFVSCFIMPVFSALAIVVDSPSLGSIRIAVVGLD